MREFCEFSKVDPDQLVLLAEKDKRNVRIKLVEFHQDYVRKKYASNTACNAYMAIRSFLSHNEILFGRFPPGFRGQTQYESRRVFSRSEVVRMLRGARSPRDKALVSFVVQSGQRVGVITQLRYGDVREQIEKSFSPAVIDVATHISKNRVRHSFAIGRECVDLIRTMINIRRGAGEPINDSSYLFRSFSRGWDTSGKKFVSLGAARLSERGKPLAGQSIGPILRNAATGGGVPTPRQVRRPKYQEGNRFELHPHAFRRWWKNAMRKGGVTDPVLLDYMMGHGMRYRGAYDGFDHDYIRKEYSKAEPQLTLLSDPSELPAKRQATPTQRIVDESDLEPLLSDGWRFVATLPSGRILVQANS
jgi:integrase